MNQTATLNDIRRSFFRIMQDAVTEEESTGRLYVVPPAQDGNPDIKSMMLISGFIPGQTTRGEMGGYGALAIREGVWKMTVSFLRDTDAGEPWELAQKLEDTFTPYTVDGIPVNDALCHVFCDFPYSEDVGELPDKRNGISVTVPWWTWTSN